MEGKLVIISAPSGAGKTTIVRDLLDSGLSLHFSVSATTRPPRGKEKDGKDYYFLSVDEFKRRIANNEFVEWEEVYKDHLYGTLKTEIDRIWATGSHVLFDVDVNGGIRLKKIFGHQAISIFLLKGIPPQKRESTEGKVGLDIGISTLAAVSDKEVMIEEFCEGLDMLEKEKRNIQRKMDRSRRATNHNKYNDDGTIKKGNKDKWIRSKRYWKNLFELKEICRKLAAKRKLMHNHMANKVLAMGNEIYCETMNYKGLQKTKFGKRIGYKAPSSFLTIMNTKLSYQGKTIQYVNTWKVKASQYCPFSNQYVKKKLSQRFHITPEGLKIQRDCFSAWLIKNVNKAKMEVERQKCLENFNSFYQAYKKTEEHLLSQNKTYISSIGF